MLDRALENEKIEVLTPYVVERVVGEEIGKVTGVVLRNVDEDADAARFRRMACS